MRKANAEKELKRRKVAAGVVAGQPTKVIARKTGTSERNVQRIAAEPATQFLITDAFLPHQKKLRAMAAKAVTVVQQGFSAMRYVKAGKDDYRLRGDAIARLRAVERYAELMELAQGKPPQETDSGGTPSITWDEFMVLYRSRRIANGQTDPIDASPQSH